MATIDDAVAFAHEYARLQLACSTELFDWDRASDAARAKERAPPKLPVNDRKSAAVRIRALAAPGASFFGDGCSTELGADGKPQLADTRRTLFAVTQHKSKRGDVFVLHMSGHDWSKDTYDEQVFVVDIDGALKIIGRMQACPRCAATGKLAKGKPCDVCRGKALWRKGVGGWPAKQGVNISKPGKHIDVRKLTPPAQPAHRAHYDAL